MAKGKSKGKTAKRPVPSAAPAFKPPTFAQRVADHADGAVRSLMDQHPMVKRMRSDMAKAIAGVAKGAARGPAARGRQRSIFQ